MFSMLSAEAEGGSGSATRSNTWARSRRFLCLAGAPEGPVETIAMGGWDAKYSAHSRRPGEWHIFMLILALF